MSALTTLIQICLMRAGPQALPPSPAFTAWTCAAYLAMGVAFDRLMATGHPAVLLASAHLVLMAVFTYLLLAARGTGNRIWQTLAAMAGTAALLTAVFMAAYVISGSSPGELNPMLALPWLGLLLWSLGIDAHIFKHALSVSFAIGLLVASALFVLGRLLSWLMLGS